MAGNIQFKVEKGRVLVPVGQPCRFGCKYCYTRTGDVGPAKVDAEEILSQFEEFVLSNAFTTIQFGYDGDPFDRPERGIMMLERLAQLGKHVSFSTKARIDETILKALDNINKKMSKAENTLVAFISLSCWDSASTVEPHTPAPQERVANVPLLKVLGIPTYIALRPILPSVPDTEYEQLAQASIDAGSDGIVLGPLYSDDEGRIVRFIPPDTLSRTPHRQVIVAWSAHTPEWMRYEDATRLHQIASMIRSKGGNTFMASVDAIEAAHKERQRFYDRGRTQDTDLINSVTEAPT